MTLYNKADLVEDFAYSNMPSFLPSLRIVCGSCRSIVFGRSGYFEAFTFAWPAFPKSYKIHDLSVAILRRT